MQVTDKNTVLMRTILHKIHKLERISNKMMHEIDFELELDVFTAIDVWSTARMTEVLKRLDIIEETI